MNVKHSIVLPKSSPISKLIIAWCHKKTGHAGRGRTLNEIRTSEFQIVCANSTTRKFIHYCGVDCGVERETRFQEEPPFTYCEDDLFGPFVICSKRKELKPYGVMFK